MLGDFYYFDLLFMSIQISWGSHMDLKMGPVRILETTESP
jgi:hypothetical protein